MRARRKPWAGREISESEKVISDPSALKGKWADYFGDSNPVHLEIGCGKGQFINTLSRRTKDVHYIAIERELNVIATAARSARENGNDVTFIVGDVKDLETYFAPGEIGRIYINFCDPWHRKKKWAKRRLTHKNFLNIYETIFDEQGEVYLKTDNRVLFEFSLNSFAEQGWRLKNITLDLHNSDYEGNIMTEYEEKFSGQGQPIYRTEAYFLGERKEKSAQGECHYYER